MMRTGHVAGTVVAGVDGTRSPTVSGLSLSNLLVDTPTTATTIILLAAAAAAPH